MKMTGFGEPQILAILYQAAGGVPVAELWREHGMSTASFHKQRAKCGGKDASIMSQINNLEDETRRLKRMSADLSMQANVLEKPSGKVTRPSQRREMATRAVKHRGVSIVSETCYRCRPST